MGEFDSTTYSLSDDGRNVSVVMFAVEKVPETKSPFKSGLLAPPSGLGLRVPSPLPLSFGKYPQEELRSAGGARRWKRFADWCLAPICHIVIPSVLTIFMRALDFFPIA
jgi:hypothetical protein